MTGFGDTAFTIAAISRGIADAGGEEAVGAGLGIGGEPLERHAGGVGVTDEPGFTARRQDHGKAGGVDRRARRPDALDRQALFVEGRGLVARGILDRQAGDARGDAERHVGGDPLGLVGVARLEVGVHGERRGRDDVADVLQHGVERNGADPVRQSPSSS